MNQRVYYMYEVEMNHTHGWRKEIRYYNSDIDLDSDCLCDVADKRRNAKFIGTVSKNFVNKNHKRIVPQVVVEEEKSLFDLMTVEREKIKHERKKKVTVAAPVSIEIKKIRKKIEAKHKRIAARQVVDESAPYAPRGRFHYAKNKKVRINSGMSDNMVRYLRENNLALD